MSKPRIDARQVLEDLRAGFDDTYLMEKYNLSARGLQSLFKKLVAGGLVDRWLLEGGRPQGVGATTPGERQVSAKEVIEDLRSGMSQDAMMHKYRLSARGLSNLFEQLVEAGLMAESELDQGISMENTVEITEKGLGEVMAKTDVGEAKTQEETLGQSQPEKLEAVAPGDITATGAGAEPVWQCPTCKEHSSGESDRCPKCGTAITRLVTEQEKPFGDESSTGVEQTMELIWQCPACGVRQYKAFDVCPECGAVGADYTRQTSGEEPRAKQEGPSGIRAGEALSDSRKDPDIEVAWLKDGLEGGFAEFRKRPYTKLVRLARALSWIALIQLVVLVLVAFGRLLMMQGFGVNAVFVVPSVLIPLFVSVVAYVVLRSASEMIRMGIDMAHSLTESNRLLAQVLERTKRKES